MYTCPHCGQPGISAWRKARVTYLSPAECRLCKGKAGVRASRYYLAVLPIFLLPVYGLAVPAIEPRVLVTWLFVPYFLGGMILAACLLASVYALRLQCVPLVRR